MNVTKIGINGHLYQIELAISPEQRMKGLMHRPELQDDRGMLLVYSRAGDHRIWMKNMLIALRVYWIDADYRVIGHHRVEPCAETPCPVYGVPEPSKYILELNDSDHAIAVGDRVSGLSSLP